MNTIKSILLAFLACTFCCCSYKHIAKHYDTQVYFENNETNSYKYTMLEDVVQNLVKSKKLNFDSEYYHAKDILDSKEKAIAYAKKIAIFEFPKCEEAINRYEAEVIEDKTSKMWFVKVRLDKGGLDTVLSLLILKNNCKVIFKTNYF